MAWHKKPLFRSKLIQEHFEKQGYVKLKLLTEADLEQLEEIHSRYMNDFKPNWDGWGLHTSALHNDEKSNLKLNEEIRLFLEAKFSNILVNAEIMGGSFIHKNNSNHPELGLHQDWNLVDENNYDSCAIWLPFAEVNKENGALFFLPGSHRYFNNYRSGSYSSRRISTDSELRKYCKTEMLNSGELLIYHHAIFHGSHQNTSNQIRKVCIGSLKHSEAQLIYYHQNESDQQCEMYEADFNLFFKTLEVLENRAMPKHYKRINSINYKHESITLEMLKEKAIKKNWFHYLFPKK